MSIIEKLFLSFVPLSGNSSNRHIYNRYGGFIDIIHSLEDTILSKFCDFSQVISILLVSIVHIYLLIFVVLGLIAVVRAYQFVSS